MTSSAVFVTHFLGAGILLSDILIVLALLLIILLALKKAPSFSKDILDLFSTWGIHIAFLSVLGSLLGSLYYSEIVGFPPCNFCIIQRILMYPQIIFLGIALWKRQYASVALSVSLVFSMIGALIGSYQYYGQMFNASLLPCAANAVSCARREFVEYGYITIPMMAVTSFLIIIVSLWLYRIGKRRA